MRNFISALAVTAVLVGILASPASAASQGRTVVATIQGGGTSVMDPSDAAGAGPSTFGMGITLYSDGTASGHFDCVDQRRADMPGNIWGEVTGWSGDLNGTITLTVVGKTITIPGGHPVDVVFTVGIQQFGGAGVGHWTLVAYGITFCIETLTSGQIVRRLAA